MNELNHALQAFASGQLDYAGLLRTLGNTLRTNPASVPEATALLDEALREGRLSPDVHADFLRRITVFQNSQTSGAAPPPSPAATSTPTPTPTDDNDEPAGDRTVMRAPPPPSADQRTRITTGHGQGQPTGASGPATSGVASVPGVTGAPPYATGTSNVGYGTGTSGGSSWGSPSQWTGGSTGGSPLAVNSVIKQRFVLQEEIGKGGMGVVYKALDLRKQEAHDRNPFVAVKVLNEEFKKHPESLKALQREARKAQDLAHPNIVNVFDFDRDGENVYMTMEYLEGEPLDELIQRNAMTGLPREEAMPMIRGMALALDYAHQKGIVHSDFKPGNCFLHRDGVIKVFDFGIARAAKQPDDAEGEKTLFDAGTLGALTPAYASCEMLDGEEPDQRDDIYALGCSAYELLAGKHPFGKRKATAARAKNLVPEPIKGLSKREQRALLHALAFNREERTQSAHRFLQELLPKKSQKGMLIGASAAAAGLLTVLGVIVIPDWLHQRKMGQFITALHDGADDEVWRVLPEVLALPAVEQTEVFQTTKDRVIDAYERRINEQIDASRDRYDYPAAETLVSELRSLFTDSQRVGDIAARVDEGKRQEELRQTTLYNQLLADGKLLPIGNEQDITDVLAIVRQVAPASALLTDPRLSGAYAAAAEAQLVDNRDLPQARRLLRAGLEAFPGDATMVNLLDEVEAKQRRAEMAQRIAELETQLAQALPGVKGLADFQPSISNMRELADLDDSAPQFTRMREKLQSILTGELKNRTDEKQWPVAESLLQEYAPLVGDSYVQTQRTLISNAQAAHEQKLAALFTEFTDAVQARRLQPPAQNSAVAVLERLAGAGADEAMMQQARSGLGQAYLALAREARADSRFEDARKQVALGLAAKPGDTLERSLSAETDEIQLAQQQQESALAAADRQRLQAQREERVTSLQAQFQKGLREPTFDSKMASSLLQTLDQLAAVSPTDPLLDNGRIEVGRRLSEQARALAARGEWDQAIALATDSLAVIPDSELLTTSLAELKSQRVEGERQAQAQQVQNLKNQLEKLLAAPAYSDAWDNSVRNELQALSAALAVDDPYVSARRDQVARLYLAQATDRRLEQRYSEANTMLERAEKFAPELAELKTERATVAAAKAKFDTERTEQNRLAKLEGDKQTFLVEARADSVSKAKNTFNALQSQLPANDPFLTETAPQALGDAYERLASRSAERGRFDSALKLADAGLEFVPDRASLRTARDTYDRSNNVDNVRGTLTAGSTSAVRDLAGLLSTVREGDNNYPALERDFAGVLAQRIRRLESSDYETASALLDAGRTLFRGNSTLAGLVLTPPVTVTAAVEPAPAPTPVATAPPPVKVATATRPAPTSVGGGTPCRSSLAGYGSRGRRGLCFDMLPGDVHGPDLVVVPAGGGSGAAFAITRYEISAGDYQQYCRISGQCSFNAGTTDLPLTGISLAEAQKFAAWLSSVTGEAYRLPTESEWEHAANAGGAQPGRDFNCEFRDIQGRQVKGLGLVNVNSGDRNGWGLYNYVGNVQEWTVSGGSVVARGGAYTDSMSKCTVELSKQHSGAADDVTGFRLVRIIR